MLATCLLLPAGLEAAPCGRPDVDFTLPAHQAASVPPNARLAAHYASPALYDDEEVLLSDANRETVALLVSFDEAESILYASPERELLPGFHELIWPGLRGVSGAGVGRGSTISFFVQGSGDAEAPRFPGIQALDWDLARDRDPCLDQLEDRFVFRLELAEASDDRALELLLVRVFETRRPNGSPAGAPKLVATRPYMDGPVLELRRPANAGRTCFAAVVQDTLGSVSGGGERELCAETLEPPLFAGCSLGAPRPAPGGIVVFSVGCALLLLLRGAERAPKLERRRAG